MRNHLILLLFLYLSLSKGFEFFSLWVVSLAYIKFMTIILEQISILQIFIKKLNLPYFIEKRVTPGLGGLIIDMAIYLIISLAF